MTKRKRTNNDLQDTTQKNEREGHEPQSPFVFFLVAIVLSVLLQFTDSDYPFGIFKLLLEPLLYSSTFHFVNYVKTELYLMIIVYYFVFYIDP